ncbi:MAG TPA: cyclopropane-fatty-acyl-phospholipid synthase family protein [Phycisphaerae bacterium]|nr:cyclopropane-fatty-acyl-phospholipid synthase family protein [Phycisphaerae bacterium]
MTFHEARADGEYSAQGNKYPGGLAAVAVIHEIFGNIKPRDFSVVFWDGSVWEAETHQARFRLIFRAPEVVRSMFLQPSSLTFGEAYVFGDFDVDGSLREVFPLADRLFEWKPEVLQRVRLARLLLAIPSSSNRTIPGRVWKPESLFLGRRSRHRTQQAIAFHYDLPVEFWRLWLDPRMVYSCAYFQTLQTSLQEAQERKLDYICRKLELQPGDRLLDMGCGWGSLIEYAAQHYDIVAHGVTLSEQQAKFAAMRLREAGLSDRVKVEVMNFLDVDGVYDKIASVGSVEHVPEAALSSYFCRAFHLLRPGGLFLNHGITRFPTLPIESGTSFLDRYVFPDYHLATIAETIEQAEVAGFDILDVENLREHYALTLQYWYDRLRANREQITTIIGIEGYRVFELCLLGSEHEFRRGLMGLHQTLLRKPSNEYSRAPVTREHWYTKT